MATWGQSCRCFNYVKEGWQGRSKRRAFADTQLALGERIYERNSGDRQLQGQIATLDEKIRQAEAAKTSTSALKVERKSLVLQLAAAALGHQAALSGTETEHQKAREAKATVEQHEKSMKSARSSLPPRARSAGVESASGTEW